MDSDLDLGKNLALDLISIWASPWGFGFYLDLPDSGFAHQTVKIYWTVNPSTLCTSANWAKRGTGLSFSVFVCMYHNRNARAFL